MKAGVQQSSVLGPVLSVIYKTSLIYLIESLNASFHFYAEDTKIYMTVGDSPESQEILTHIYEAVT